MYEFIVVKPAGITLRLPLWDACIPAQSESVRAAVLDKKIHTLTARDREKEKPEREKWSLLRAANLHAYFKILSSTELASERRPFFYSARATYVATVPIKNLARRRSSESRRPEIRRRQRRIGSISLANNEARARTPSLSRRSII
jgi:hypothetical protein